MKDILTEKEASERRCPYSFGAPQFTLGKGGSIEAAPEHATMKLYPEKCISSECMAWRLAHKPASSGEETGYCGAFGTPKFT